MPVKQSATHASPLLSANGCYASKENKRNNKKIILMGIVY